MSKENVKELFPALKSGSCNVLLSSGKRVVLRAGKMNVSNAVLSVLENAHKMPARDIASRVGLSCEEAIDTLLYLECVGMVHQLNGYWMLIPESSSSLLRVLGKTRRRRIRRSEHEAS